MSWIPDMSTVLISEKQAFNPIKNYFLVKLPIFDHVHTKIPLPGPHRDINSPGCTCHHSTQRCWAAAADPQAGDRGSARARLSPLNSPSTARSGVCTGEMYLGVVPAQSGGGVGGWWCKQQPPQHPAVLGGCC